MMQAGTPSLLLVGVFISCGKALGETLNCNLDVVLWELQCAAYSVLTSNRSLPTF